MYTRLGEKYLVCLSYSQCLPLLQMFKIYSSQESVALQTMDGIWNCACAFVERLSLQILLSHEMFLRAPHGSQNTNGHAA